MVASSAGLPFSSSGRQPSRHWQIRRVAPNARAASITWTLLIVLSVLWLAIYFWHLVHMDSVASSSRSLPEGWMARDTEWNETTPAREALLGDAGATPTGNFAQGMTQPDSTSRSSEAGAGSGASSNREGDSREVYLLSAANSGSAPGRLPYTSHLLLPSSATAAGQPITDPLPLAAVVAPEPTDSNGGTAVKYVYNIDCSRNASCQFFFGEGGGARIVTTATHGTTSSSTATDASSYGYQGERSRGDSVTAARSTAFGTGEQYPTVGAYNNNKNKNGVTGASDGSMNPWGVNNNNNNDNNNGIYSNSHMGGMSFVRPGDGIVPSGAGIRHVWELPLFVGVLSAPEHPAHRVLIRTTWGRYSPGEWELKFFVGYRDGDPELNLAVDNEARLYRDIVYLPLPDNHGSSLFRKAATRICRAPPVQVVAMLSTHSIK
eukprot:jgi/Mesvir1/29251/Mv06887-RA.1